VFGPKKNKERERFYLLPGQGGRNYIRKQRQLLALSVGVGLLLAGSLAFFMWYFSRLQR
jgi:hypothetical protein